jgi:uncharacterized membrane protein YozB (DUF420 family)
VSFRTVFLTVTTFLGVSVWAYIDQRGHERFKDHDTLYTLAVFAVIFFIAYLIDRSDKRRQQRQRQSS